MPSSEYFRRQADIWLRLSLLASDYELSNRWISRAKEFMAKAEVIEAESKSPPAAKITQDIAPE